MCFSVDYAPKVYRETRRRARKRHRCCECDLPILPGEEYQECAGIWDFGAETYRTCVSCEWLRERVADAEYRAGCRGAEAYPSFTGLYEALGEDHGRSIGLVDLLARHEERE